ncbi:MFS transporter [Janthinobacterium agaricidamnosum]|uniref:Major Facilitator Superfamily protein n=1 Tax=Janthinobacterium agaricidamnosum NBRC 102515 = DSM 9628 TaxID=1349767 RepID=W0V527_9BURK|nr:MFS transporter [Janthinobacterium agaricidamnosum]CDG83929.1 major Facilitator Superfamily protein [Janthinobacterium agaricidamnosum NBRC 102515 = DSM 9628]
MNTAVKTSMPPAVLSLAVSAFAIGVTEFIVVGILPAIARDLAISLESAGALVSLYALALAIGTPLLVIGLSRLPRKAALLGLMSVFLAGNLLAALSGSYQVLLFGRIITAVAHGTFFAIGATVAASLVPKGQAGRAISVMFAGLTLAMVIGVPLGSFLGNLMGWRLPFFAVVLLAALGLGAMLRWLPSGLAHGGGARASTQLAALGSLPIVTMMAITTFGFGSSFAAFTFVTPILTDITGFSATTASALLIVFGAATFAGNLAGGYLTSHYGWQRALRMMLVALALTQLVLALTIHGQVMMVLMLFVWGLFAFGLSPALQAGMLATAERYTPKAVDFASGLNISAFNLGISSGSMMGALMVSHRLMASTPWAGVAAALFALLPLAWLASKNLAQHVEGATVH